jgi:hypothetical protein
VNFGSKRNFWKSRGLLRERVSMTEKYGFIDAPVTESQCGSPPRVGPKLRHHPTRSSLHKEQTRRQHRSPDAGPVTPSSGDRRR